MSKGFIINGDSYDEVSVISSLKGYKKKSYVAGPDSSEIYVDKETEKKLDREDLVTIHLIHASMAYHL